MNFTGERIGPYYVRERIGRGGGADVYRAYQPSIRREVALKIIPFGQDTASSAVRQQFEREAAMIAALEHPHILPVFDYGFSGDVVYLAMRLLKGGTLQDWLGRGFESMQEIAALLKQIASALGYAHRRGVIHRDLKPSNILIDRERNAYLADFGLARVLGSVTGASSTNTVVGTPAYMAPEQLRGEPIDHRADIYSLGMILCHMIGGRLPAESLLISGPYSPRIELPRPLPRDIDLEVTPAIEAVILRALRENPEDRFDSAEQMAYLLDEALGQEQQEGSHQSDRHELIPPRVKQEEGGISLNSEGAHDAPRRLLRLLGIGLPLLLVLLILAVLVGRLQPQGSSEAALPTIVAGVEGAPDEVIPSAGEIVQARSRLSRTGFIAYVTCNQESVFFATLARRMQDVAAQYGLDYRIYDSETDPNLELIQIERARVDGAAALIVCVLDMDLLEDSLSAIQAARIPLILHNVSEPPSYGGVLVTHDNYQLGFTPGQAAGRIALDEFGSQQINAILLDFPSLPAIVARADGLEAGFLSAAPGASIVGRYLGGTTEFAEDSVQGLIEEGVNFNVVLSINDAGAYGAIRALEAADIDPSSVIIASVDAEALARQYIRDGYYMRVSIGVGSEVIPRTTINALVKLLAGSTVPQIILTPPGELVTFENQVVTD